MGLTPKSHPPVWTLRLCEELLDECWKAQEETGSAFVGGGAKSTKRSAAQATAGEIIALAVLKRPGVSQKASPGTSCTPLTPLPLETLLGNSFT